MRPARPAQRRAPAPNRQGTILVVTMWIVLVLASLVLILARAMRVEVICSANETASLQAEAVEQGAIQYVLSHLDGLDGEVPDDANTPCQAVRVGAGAFWILRPNFEDDRARSYGIVDEASKINANTATVEMLSKVPDMTEELAACLKDWRDEDGDVTPGGAEGEYYLLQAEAYQCKDAPLETLEELRLVKGAGEQVLFGEDINRNGVLDANEDDADACEPADNRDGRLDCGVLPFLTVYSAEPEADPNSPPRVNVNSSQTTALSNLLRENMSAARANDVLRLVRQYRPFSNVLHFYVRSGLTAEEFLAIEDRLTTGATQGGAKGLVNVNTAPREVLACLGGLTDSDAASLVARRSQAGADLTSLAWVADALRPSQADNDAAAQKLAAFGGRITTRSYQFSADIVSLSGDGRAFHRCRIVVDARTSPPRVIYRQDLTGLGWPLEPEILDQARAGGGIEQVVAGQTVRQEVVRQ